MRFLRIKTGICINTEKVEALEQIDQLNTRIYMENGGSYEAMFPYDTLIQLLEIEVVTPAEQQEAQTNTEILKRLNVLSEGSQFFAG